MNKSGILKRMLTLMLTAVILSGCCGIQAEGFLPSLTEIEGVGLPSLAEALQKYPDSETKNDDGSLTEVYHRISGSDYDAFSAYLQARETELGDYSVDKGVLTAEIRTSEASFTFVYDSDSGEVKVTYPAGTYDEWTRRSKKLLSTAQEYMDDGRFSEAVSAICRIPKLGKYAPAQELLLKETELSMAVAAHEEKLAPFRTVGGTVFFGQYEQDPEKEGAEPIEWIVLDYDEQENKALLITCYGLEWVSYGSSRGKVTYEASLLRQWGNGSFFQNAFTEKEQEAILTTEVDNSAAQGFAEWNPPDEPNTQDKVFFLSYAEAFKYFGVCGAENQKAKALPTPYLLTTENYLNTANSGRDDVGYWLDVLHCWWLRSPAKSKYDKAFIDQSGAFVNDGWRKESAGSSLLTRPVIWLDLNADIF